MNKILKLSKALVGTGLAFIVGCGSSETKQDTNSRRFEHLQLAKVGVTTKEDYLKTGKHPFDIDGDGIKDTFCVNPDGFFWFYPGNGPASTLTGEPLNGYGPSEKLGNVGQGSSDYANRAKKKY